MLKVLPHNQILLWNLSLVLFDVALLQGKDKSCVLKSQIISFFTDTKEPCVSHKPKISTSSEHTDQAVLLGLFGCFVIEDEGNAWTIHGCSSLKWYITQRWHKLGQEVKHQSPHINHMKSKTRVFCEDNQSGSDKCLSCHVRNIYMMRTGWDEGYRLNHPTSFKSRLPSLNNFNFL